MRVDRTSMKWIVALVGLLATASMLAGCGGGGGGGGSSTPSTFSYSGTVEDQSTPPNPIAGVTVVFDSTSFTSTTTSTGTFSITGVPAADVSSTANELTVQNSAGVTEGTSALPANAPSESGIVIKIGPPPPPPLVRPR